MASSFARQIPFIMDIIRQIKPSRVLDIGKGFGKYGFLIHEYIGIDNKRKLNPQKSLKEQSTITIDAVEIDNDLMLPHLTQIYETIYNNDITAIYSELPKYDLIIAIDVIEHIEKSKVMEILTHFVRQGSSILISTPKDFFDQDLYESTFEHHISHWTPSDFKDFSFVDYQRCGESMIYLLSDRPFKLSGFGNSLMKKLKRLRWSLIDTLNL